MIWQEYQKGRVKLTAVVRCEGPLVILKVTNKSEFPIWIARVNGRLPDGKACVPWLSAKRMVGEVMDLKEIRPRQQQYFGVLAESVSETDRKIRRMEVETQCGYTAKARVRVNYTLKS